jgi:hypothetical protein
MRGLRGAVSFGSRPRARIAGRALNCCGGVLGAVLKRVVGFAYPGRPRSSRRLGFRSGFPPVPPEFH